MLVVGLTGGIGSGKTTVANLFAELGVAIIDADVVSREILEQSNVINALKARFGADIINESNTINRELLRELIFNDESNLRWLNAYLHPLVRQEMTMQAQSALGSYCILTIPLLFETAPNPIIQRILVVDAPIEAQIIRAQLRDKKYDINKIMQTQVTRDQRLKNADDVITNNKSMKDLEQEVKRLHIFYTNLSQSKCGDATSNPDE